MLKGNQPSSAAPQGFCGATTEKQSGCRAATLTWREQRDGLEAAVLGRVHLQPGQLVHLVLEHPHLVHEGHHSLGGHWRGVEARRRQQRGHVERQGRLGRIQDKELAPAQPQQRHLCVCVGCFFLSGTAALFFVTVFKKKFNLLTWSDTGSSGK